MWAYRRIGGGFTRAAPLSDGTYRTYGTNTSPTHRSHESYKSHSVAEPHAYAHPPSPRYAHTPPPSLPRLANFRFARHSGKPWIL